MTRNDQTPSVLAVIPARGGSKRVTRKNLREIDGKPLIAHTIDHADASDRVTKAVVSTEDEEIKRTAREYGGSVPFDRPASLATDTADTTPVVSHAIDWYEERGETFEVVCLLQVTSPLRRPEDIDSALSRLEGSDARSIVSTSEYADPPQWAMETDENGYLVKYFDEDQFDSDEDDGRSKDLRTLRHPNGAVFAATLSSWRDEPGFYTDKTIEYQMPPERSIDIDEPWELTLARCLFERMDEVM